MRDSKHYFLVRTGSDNFITLLSKNKYKLCHILKANMNKYKLYNIVAIFFSIEPISQ